MSAGWLELDARGEVEAPLADFLQKAGYFVEKPIGGRIFKYCDRAFVRTSPVHLGDTLLFKNPCVEAPKPVEAKAETAVDEFRQFLEGPAHRFLSACSIVAAAELMRNLRIDGSARRPLRKEGLASIDKKGFDGWRCHRVWTRVDSTIEAPQILVPTSP